MPQTDSFDYFQPAFREDPYAFYARLREDDPVHWGIGYEPPNDLSMWHVARHADIVAVLRDPRFAHSLPPEEDAAAPAELSDATIFHTLSAQSLLFIDPPAHTRLRRLVGNAFTPKMVERLRPRVQELANERLTAAAAAGNIDIISEYAQPITTTIIAEMLGVPPEAREHLARWAAVLVRALDCKQSGDIYGPATQVAWEVIAFFQEAITERRANLGDDLLSALIQAHDAEDRLNEQELIVTLTTLLIAGHETTVNLIGNGTLALLRHPDQLALLRQQPDLITPAVEEFLRFDAPSQMASRVASEDLPLGGKIIHRGQTVNLLLGSGNHDPEAFPYPDKLDVGRSDNRQLAFGMGMHYCLGAPLARLEGQVAIGTLLARFPNLRMADPAPHWRDTIGFRGLTDLRLEVQ